MVSSDVRPLGAGELLDRAVTLFVRRFGPIVLVLAVVVLPLTAWSFFISPNQGHLTADMQQLFGAGANAAVRQRALQAVMRDMNAGAFAGWYAVATALRALMWTAVLALTASAYAGAAPNIGAAYRIAVKRWLPQILVAVAYFGISLVVLIPAYIAFVVYAVVATIVTVFLNNAAHALGVAFGIVAALLGLGLLFAFCALIAWVYLAWNLSAFAVATGDGNPATAVGEGIRGVTARGTRVRALIAALIVGAVSLLGTLPLLGIGGIAAALTHSDIPNYAIVGAGGILIEGLIAAFVVVYATDVRVRREGLDLVRTMDGAEPPAG